MSPGTTAAEVHLVTAYVPTSDLPSFARAVAPHLSEFAPDQPVVVDVESWRDESLLPDEEMAAELARCSRVPFGRALRRLTVTVTSAAEAPRRRGLSADSDVHALAGSGRIHRGRTAAEHAPDDR